MLIVFTIVNASILLLQEPRSDVRAIGKNMLNMFLIIFDMLSFSHSVDVITSFHISLLFFIYDMYKYPKLKKQM